MEDDRFFEIREKLCGLIREFQDECEKADIDLEEELDRIIAER